MAKTSTPNRDPQRFAGKNSLDGGAVPLGQFFGTNPQTATPNPQVAAKKAPLGRKATAADPLKSK